jgi:hypothetical protein
VFAGAPGGQHGRLRYTLSMIELLIGTLFAIMGFVFIGVIARGVASGRIYNFCAATREDEPDVYPDVSRDAHPFAVWCSVAICVCAAVACPFAAWDLLVRHL